MVRWLVRLIRKFRISPSQSNRIGIVRLEFESNLEASQVPIFKSIIIIIIIIIIKNEKIRVTLCENATGTLYIVNKMCVDGHRNVEG